MFQTPRTAFRGRRLVARSSLSDRRQQEHGSHHSRLVLRSVAGTILLSGALWPSASFGSPRGHSLSRGTRARGPGPEIQWMLSPEPFGDPERSIAGRHPLVPPCRSRAALRTALESLRVVFLLCSPHRQRDRGDLPGDGQLRQVRLRPALQQPHVVAVDRPVPAAAPRHTSRSGPLCRRGTVL
jgi:hypothetical protein